MAASDKHTALEQIELQKYIPLFYCEDLGNSKNVISACAQSGCRVVEFTNRGGAALSVFSELVTYAGSQSPEILLGVGSVIDLETAKAFVEAGADFVVGPSFNAEIADYCHSSNILYIPGCMTLNEILHATQQDIPLVKVFPASAVGGPEFIKAVRGPCPWLKLLPTGGVSTEEGELKAWFTAGATAIGLGSNVISKQRVEEGDFGAITEALSRVEVVVSEFR